MSQDLRHVKESYEYEKYFVGEIHRPFLRQVSPGSPLHVSAGNCHSALVDELGMFTYQTRTLS
jgi:hypothetical protein